MIGTLERARRSKKKTDIPRRRLATKSSAMPLVKRKTIKGRLGWDGSLEDLLQGAGSHEFPCRRHSSLYVVHKHCSVGHILHSITPLRTLR